PDFRDCDSPIRSSALLAVRSPTTRGLNPVLRERSATVLTASPLLPAIKISAALQLTAGAMKVATKAVLKTFTTLELESLRCNSSAALISPAQFILPETLMMILPETTS